MISEEAFWRGPDDVDRRTTYASEVTAEIEENGRTTVRAANPLIAEYEAETGLKIDHCSSGWRPKVVNEHTSNAGALSAHIEAGAEDVTGKDDLAMSEDGSYAFSKFARWCARNPTKLKAYGLYMEDWRYTAKKHVDPKTLAFTWAVWCHLTTRAPHSGHVCYLPFDPAKVAPPIPLTEVA